MTKIYAGDKNKVFKAYVGTDIVLTGLTCHIYYIQPDGTTGEWDATQVSTTQYIQTGTEDIATGTEGTWKLQAKCGDEYGETYELVVYPLGG